MKTLLMLLSFILPSVSFSQISFLKITSGQLVNTPNYNHMLAWGDYDNDNDQDLVITGYNDNIPTGVIPLQFYRNDGGGNFTRIIDNTVAQTSVIGSAIAWGDYDNDGWLDLFITGTYNSKNKLFHNDQNGDFTEITTGEIVNELNSSHACGWADYDKDGYLDIFITNRYGIYSNKLFRNNGDGTFTKILSGSIANEIGESRGCAWGDYDNDGWTDLFVANFSGQNDYLYHNNGNGTFTRIFDQPPVNDGLSGSTCGWIDFDNNGFLDLYVTNIGGKNRLFYNQGDGIFTVNNSELSQEVNGLGFSWGDYDNDGNTDLFVCKNNSYNILYKNMGGSVFTKILNESPVLEGLNSVTSTFIDYDLDGKLDLMVANRFNYLYNYIYKNVGNTGNYVTVKLIGQSSNKNGIGAKVKIVTGNTFQYKEISSGYAWNSEFSLWPHFGIGNNQGIDSLIVYWPSNEITRSGYVSGNRIVVVDESLGIIGINNQTTYIYKYKLFQNYPNPFNPSTTINYEIAKSSNVDLSIFDINGKKILTIVNELKRPGNYSAEFNGNSGGLDLSSGTYFYKLTAGDYSSTQKMILIK